MNWIKIEKRSNWLINIPSLHPDSTNYINFWKEVKRKCIEGYWGEDFGKYRYMPGFLFFYVNICRILDVNSETKTRRNIKPLLRDIEWELSYLILEARGFSGWRDDEEYSSDIRLKEVLENDKKLSRYKKLADFRHNITQEGKLKKYIPARDNIKKLHNKPLGPPLYNNNAKNIMVFGCLKGEQGVRMFDGSIKQSKDIIVGDKLMGPDSTPRIVQELLRGEAPMYNVSSRYGSSYNATFSHTMHLNKKVQKKYNDATKIFNEPVDISIDEFLSLPEHRQKDFYESIMSNCIEYPKQKLEWDPYLLGLWLGDGFKARKMICGSFDDDKETLDWLIDHSKNNPNHISHKITEYIGSLGTKKLFRFSWIDKTMLYKNNWFAKTLFKNKHIPNEYLNTTSEDRLKLLAGMIDSDGGADCNGKRLTITNCDLKLLKQFQEVARSLGFRAVINKPHKSGITNSLKYNLRITGELSKIPTKLKRKKGINSYLGCGSNKNDIKIIPIGVEKFYGFETDKDHLFLLDDYTITHNSRGSGKSYYIGIGVVLHEIVFDGAKYYTEESIMKPEEVHCNIGSAESSKSSELCEKIQLCMNAFATDSELGVWGDESRDDYTPNPFYKSMSGTLSPNNSKSPWIHSYEKKVNGRYLKFGTKSKIVHSVYKDNPTSAAGGRYTIMVNEECGLEENLTLIHNSNIACTERSSTKFGILIYIGTSGDIVKVRSSRKMFTDPDSYDIVSYNDDYENSGRIGFFIPAFYANNDFKDEQGNTDEQEAIEYYLERRKKAKASKDAANYEGELMNYPMKPSEMFLTKKGNILPIGELEEHRANLITDSNRGRYFTVGSIIYDNKESRGVKFMPDVERVLKPIMEYPTPKNQDVEGACIMYEPPIEDFVSGRISVPDIYVIGMDPVDADTSGIGLSLSAFHVLKLPLDRKKYGGNELCFSFIGRPYMGRDAVNEILEKTAMLYGAHNRMINFERGGNVKEYFEKKKKLNLLMTEPKTVMSYKSGQSSRILLYGTPLKSFEAKFEAIKYLRDWLLEEYGEAEDGRIVRNLNLIRDQRLIEEMIAFDFDNNYDSTLAFAECIIGLREKYNQFQDEAVKEVKQNDILSFLNNNLAARIRNSSFNY